MWDRLKGKKVAFSEKLEYDVRDRLTRLVRAHGGTIAPKLNSALTYFITPTKHLPKPTAQQIKALNAKGAMIQSIVLEDFATMLTATEAEVINVIRRGKK